jgi:hypothetical protein
MMPLSNYSALFLYKVYEMGIKSMYRFEKGRAKTALPYIPLKQINLSFWKL